MKAIVDIYPLYYFSGRRGSKSDRDWIHAGMAKLPHHARQGVADNYDRIYRQFDCELTNEYMENASNRREAANRYLADVVRAHCNNEKPRNAGRFNRTIFDSLKQGEI